MFYYFTTTRN